VQDPVQDPVPRVKGIGGMHTEYMQSSRLAKAKTPAKASKETVRPFKTAPFKKSPEEVHWEFSDYLETQQNNQRSNYSSTSGSIFGTKLYHSSTGKCLNGHRYQDFVFDTSVFEPISQGFKIENLCAYHMRLDILNEIESPDRTKADWDVLFIEKYVTRQREDKSAFIVFKVQWLGGDKSWVKMSDLRLHDPLLVLRYGLRHQITRKPGWEWVENFVNSNGELSQIIHAYKVSIRKRPISLVCKYTKFYPGCTTPRFCH
jgi:hypothetical protein